MRRLIFLAAALAFGSCTIHGAHEEQRSTTVTADSGATPAFMTLPGYAAPDSTAEDTLTLRSGDSVFVFDGELYYRARANGRDFFIKSRELLALSDSLIVFQTYRLTAPSSGERISGKTAIDSSPATSKTIVRQRCAAITQNGTRCKRWAQPGSDKCWQHQGK